MATNQHTTPAQTASEQTAHERAVAVMKRLINDKYQAEKSIVDNFHTDPLIQAALAKLKEENAQRGTPIVRL